MTPGCRVVYVTRFVPGYRIPVLEALNSALDGKLTVASGQPPTGSSMASLETSGQTGFARIALRNRWLGGERLHWQDTAVVHRSMEPPAVAILEESPRTVSLPLTIRSFRRAGIPVMLWGHFSSRLRDDSGRDVRDRYRRWLSSQADGLITYSEAMAAELGRAMPGMPVFAAPNTLESGSLEAARARLASGGRSVLRKQLGLDPVRPCLVFIGRFIPEKAGHRFLDTCLALGADRIQAVMIGDGPEREALQSRARESGLAVHFTGALPDPVDAAPWMVASDLLLNPGYVGLSLNHAMLLGLPVVAPESGSAARHHSPEWDFLVHGHNGWKAASEQAEDLATAVRSVLDDLTGFQERTLAYARSSLTTDRMVGGLMKAITWACSKAEVAP